MTTMMMTASNSNNKTIAPASPSVASVMTKMRLRLLSLTVKMAMAAFLLTTTTTTTTTTCTALSPPLSHPSAATRRGVSFRGSSSKTIAMAAESGGGQQQHHHMHMITPMDGEHGFQYLDPLKQFPSNELKAKLEKHNAMIDHLALCPSTSRTFASLPPSDCFVGNSAGINSNRNNKKALVKHYGSASLAPSTTSNKDGSSSSSHFESHRKDLGWYAEEEIPTTTGNNVQMHYGDLDFFAFDKLTSKGPRKNSDIGKPEDYSRPLCKDIQTVSSKDSSDSISCGSWYCTQGGWPSKTPRATTEIFYVWKGFGCLTDIDGQRNYFSPGDTVILPKGWSGRWDIAEDVYKVWFVYDHHEEIEEDTTSTIRAKIIHYNDLVSTSKKEELIVGANLITKPIYNIGPTNVMLSTSGPSYFVVSPRQYADCFHILEGSMMLEGSGSGSSVNVKVGDTIVLPKGWTGRFNVKETIKALRVKV